MKGLVTVVALLLLSACGQKGDLYFAPPPAEQAATAAPTEAVPADAAAAADTGTPASDAAGTQTDDTE